VTNKGKKLEPPLKLDMCFGEAMERFVATSPEEVDESIERSKTKRPPQDGTLRRPSPSPRGRKSQARGD
jgi:hypothetical protein